MFFDFNSVAPTFTMEKTRSMVAPGSLIDWNADVSGTVTDRAGNAAPFVWIEKDLS